MSSWKHLREGSVRVGNILVNGTVAEYRGSKNRTLLFQARKGSVRTEKRTLGLLGEGDPVCLLRGKYEADINGVLSRCEALCATDIPRELLSHQENKTVHILSRAFVPSRFLPPPAGQGHHFSSSIDEMCAQRIFRLCLSIDAALTFNACRRTHEHNRL